jgi:preprotein translocase subunit YajC
MLIDQAFAQTAPAGPGGGDFIIQLLPIALIFVVFYFLMIRPQQRKVKEHRAMVAALRRGDRVVTSGGIVGTVAKTLGDNELLVEIADGVRVKVMRGSISEVLAKTAPAAASGETADDTVEEAESTSDLTERRRNREVGGKNR